MGSGGLFGGRRPVSRRERPDARAIRQDRHDRLSVGCRWLSTVDGVVWEVVRVYRRAIKLVSLHTGTRLTIYEARRMAAKGSGWRPLRGAEFRRSFEIVRGDAPLQLVRGRLPSGKALRALRRSGASLRVGQRAVVDLRGSIADHAKKQAADLAAEVSRA